MDSSRPSTNSRQAEKSLFADMIHAADGPWMVVEQDHDRRDRRWPDVLTAVVGVEQSSPR